MLLLVLVAGLLAGVSAQIDLRPYNLTASLMFIANDLNNDGHITLPEFKNVFKIYDFNNDTIIERNEYVCYITRADPDHGHLAHALYDEYDHNEDHKLDPVDFEIFFKRMDENGNSIVTDLEFVRVWEMILITIEPYTLGGESHKHHSNEYCREHGHTHG